MWREGGATAWIDAHRNGLTLVALVAFDLTTKAIAAHFLPPHQPIDEAATLQLVLRWNALGYGSWVRELGPSVTDRFISGFGYTVLGVAVIPLARSRWSRVKKVLGGVGVLCVGFVVGSLIADGVEVASPRSTTFVARFGTVVFFPALWWVARPGLWQITTMLFSAAALGNFLCLFPPPHAVVDFIYSRPLTRLLSVGVVNFADLYYDGALVCLVLLIARFLFRRMRGHVDSVSDGRRKSNRQ